MSEEKPAWKNVGLEIDNLVFIPYWIKCAKSGCQQSARTLVELAADCLSSGEEFPPALGTYLKEAFQAITLGKSADKALYLCHERGKNDTALYRKQAIANEVQRLYWIGEAKTIDEACEFVSKHGVKKLVPDGKGNLIHVDAKTARKYFYEIHPGKPQRRPIK